MQMRLTRAFPEDTGLILLTPSLAVPPATGRTRTVTRTHSCRDASTTSSAACWGGLPFTPATINWSHWAIVINAPSNGGRERRGRWLPGHGWSLHCCSSTPGPAHGAPLSLGGGSLHSLILLFIPPSQVELHSDHPSHGPQLPSTTIENTHLRDPISPLTPLHWGQSYDDGFCLMLLLSLGLGSYVCSHPCVR